MADILPFSKTLKQAKKQAATAQPISGKCKDGSRAALERAMNKLLAKNSYTIPIEEELLVLLWIEGYQVVKREIS